MNRRKITITFDVTDDSPMCDADLAGRLGGYACSGLSNSSHVSKFELVMSNIIRNSTGATVIVLSCDLSPSVSVQSEK